MWIDPLREHKGKDIARVVQVQLEAWLYESHCWVQQADGTLKCAWCGMVRFDAGYAPASDSSDKGFPICRDNPALKLLLGNPLAAAVVEQWDKSNA